MPCVVVFNNTISRHIDIGISSTICSMSKIIHITKTDLLLNILFSSCGSYHFCIWCTFRFGKEKKQNVSIRFSFLSCVLERIFPIATANKFFECACVCVPVPVCLWWWLCRWQGNYLTCNCWCMRVCECHNICECTVQIQTFIENHIFIWCSLSDLMTEIIPLFAFNIIHTESACLTIKRRLRRQQQR